MSDITVFFATNRNYLPDNKLAVFGAHFNPDGVAALRFGKAGYTRTDKAPRLDAVEVYPETKAGDAFTQQGSAGFLEDLRLAMKGERVSYAVSSLLCG